ncbi:MAG: DUF4405 domain-containing protein [Bacteroidales bacterium]|nr:DUF4405 domain-containing protein [Bacteroidales bacterium]MDD4383699.1 DUF4405 domain-containing protein [Bacteroidales bacterium]MDY0196230.1 DUF4405 domain-containing protein [Tenuifilaceae bacterium]
MNTKKSILKDKAKLNLCIDFVLFLLLAAMAGIGLLIKYVLISGESRNLIYGDGINLLLWGLDRHEWGTIHLIISLVFIFFLVLHVIFHWSMILCLLRRLIPNRIGRIAFSTIITVLATLLFVFAFLITPTQVYHEHNFRNRTNNTSPLIGEQELTPSPEISDEAVTREEQRDKETKHKEEKVHKHKNQTIEEEYEVQGTYTLDYVADKYNIPSTYLCNELNIPQNLTSQRLGRLRKKYNFAMSDVSRAISSYKNQSQQ